MRIYLDTCCLNRPFDDQSIPRNRIEGEAVLSILDEIHAGAHELVNSEALEWEVDQDSSAERKEQVRAYLSLSSDFVPVTAAEKARTADLVAIGLRPLDALHTACAEAGGCDVLLTTDDRFLRRAVANAARLSVRVQNPVDWIMGPRP